MRILIAGGHGQIALRLQRLLAAKGHEPVGLIRNPEQRTDLADAGAEAIVLDLESATIDEVTAAYEGVDAAVFAAGAGPGSGVDRKDTVDRAAAVLFADAAVRAGVRRHVVVSAMRADADHPGDEVFDAYLRAKGAADDHVRAQDGLDWTVLRPGMLTDDAGTGLVRLEESTGRGPVPRDDVAAVLATLLEDPGTAGRTLELVSGDTPVIEAVSALTAS